MRTALRIALSFALALALVALLLYWTGTRPSAVVDALAALDPRAYWIALGLHGLLYPLRALRFRALLPAVRRPSTARLLPATSAYIMAANVLPAKLGETTLVLYLRRVGEVPAAHGLAVLLVSRLLDFATIAGGMALACLVLGLSGTYGGLPWLVPLGLGLVAPAAGFAWLGVRGERVVALAAGFLHALRLERTLLGARLATFAERVRAALEEQSARQLLVSALLTLPIWVLVFLAFAVLARGLGIDAIGFPEVVFGAGLAILAGLLPLSVFAGFGVQDAGWVAGFTALGVGAGVATSSGLSAHLVVLFNATLFGLAGHVAMGLLPPADSSG